MADESGSGFGGGGISSAERDRSIEAGGFGGRGGFDVGPGYGNVQDLIDREIDRVTAQNALADLMSEREQERPGRFGARSVAARSYDIGSGVFGLLRGLLSLAPPGPASLFGHALNFGSAMYKTRNLSDEEKELAFGRAALSLVPGFDLAVGMGKGLQRGARAMGMKGGDQPGFGAQPADLNRGGVRDVDPYSDTTKFDRSQILADARRSVMRDRLYGGA